MDSAVAQVDVVVDVSLVGGDEQGVAQIAVDAGLRAQAPAPPGAVPRRTNEQRSARILPHQRAEACRVLGNRPLAAANAGPDSAIARRWYADWTEDSISIRRVCTLQATSALATLIFRGVCPP
ncbi:hypothetical protein [Streptomyces sp. NPDC006012]|uniref:hypothetical protein n=1 Tax=Streptomyces sp. NPDC006012 TaxID=3364739 RepID=UPI00369EE979